MNRALNMRRGKREVKRIENKTSRQVTFSKRQAGLIKKSHELSVLCDAQIGLILFSSKGKLAEYSTPPLSMKEILGMYVKDKGISVPENDNPSYNMYEEITRIKNETLNLQLSIQRYTGEDDLSGIQFEELRKLEHQLEQSVQKIRSRKFQLIHEQLENLKRTEVLLDKENQEMHHWLMRNEIEKQAAMEHEEAMAELKMMEEQPLLNQLSFFGGSYDHTNLPLFNLQDSDLHSGRIE